MTFVEDVAALRRLLGVAKHHELQPAILAMNLAIDAPEAPEAAGSVKGVAAAGGGFRRFRRFLAPIALY
jgi:hypothetical protein